MRAKLKFGIIGCGMVTGHHINGLRKIKNIEIKWLCDKSGLILKTALKEFNVTLGTQDYKEILQDIDVNAVIICTPPNTHFQIANDAINAKKHILLEKPIAIDLNDANKLAIKAKENPRLTIMDCSPRHSRLQPKYYFIREFINSGALGRVYCIHHNAVYRQSRPGIEYHPEASWFFNKKLSGGGPLIDWGVYDLSFHLGILNDVPQLKNLHSFYINGLDIKSSSNELFDVEEHGLVTMKFDNELVYYWERATNAHIEVPNETRVYGTKGGLKFDYLSWDSNDIIYYSLAKNGKTKNEILPFNTNQSVLDDFYKLDEHFINCLLGSEKPILDFSLSVKHLDIILRALSPS